MTKTYRVLLVKKEEATILVRAASPKAAVRKANNRKTGLYWPSVWKATEAWVEKGAKDEQ